ncbi:hypothetical protein [Nonomuraea aurantiaca]|uniref:hypothetical protein n=1 Tax=Nonomuraea aurantiaca TaxID=2878562 RepID=UPI001CD9C408|nr:hypothetical protein [Nonomuraea aurantiaca]MCA2229493.1 hypothetical protein [Nonomuraea aurantiaca]
MATRAYRYPGPFRRPTSCPAPTTVTWTGLSGVVAAAVHTICSTASVDSLSAGVDGFIAQWPA